MELLSLAVLAIGGWLIWKFGRDKPKPKPKATSEPTVQQDVEYLRRMAGITDKTPYTPLKPRPQPTVFEWAEPAPVNSGLKYLRQLCREARLDEEITEGEARKLLHAFAVFESDQPSSHTHAKYVLELLRECLADGKLDKNEAHELLTAVGEFADSAPLPVMPLGDIRPTWDTPEPPTIKKERLRKTAAATPLRNISLTPGQEYELTYTDSTGAVSERVIQFKGLSGNGRAQYLQAYCTKAHGYRTFRVDRVMSLVDLSTGEVMLDA
jgi:hypothetical protein